MRKRRPVSLAALALLSAIGLGASAHAQTSNAIPDIEELQGRTLSDVEMMMVGADLNRLDVVLHLLAKGTDPNARGRNGFTALMVAAGKGSLNVMEILLSKGADANLANDEGWTALMEAVLREREKAVDVLLRAGADVNAMETRRGLSPLMIAAKTDKPDLVSSLIGKGAQVNAQNKRRGLTALHYALTSTEEKAEEIVAELLGAGADANKPASDGFTPLMSAVDSGKVQRVTLLLAEKVNVDARTDDGRDALILAAGNGDADIAEKLLDAGADARPTAGAKRPLTEAIRSGSLDLVRLLIEREASVDEPGGDGKTPLIVAAQNGHEEIALLLLERGADVNATNATDGTTALMWAANNGRVSIVALLVERGADASITAKDGWTAGEAARMAGHDNIAQMLERPI